MTRISSLLGSPPWDPADESHVHWSSTMQHRNEVSLCWVLGVSCDYITSKRLQNNSVLLPFLLLCGVPWAWELQSSTKTQSNGHFQPLLRTLCTQYLLDTARPSIPDSVFAKDRKRKGKKKKNIVMFLYFCWIYSKVVWHYCFPKKLLICTSVMLVIIHPSP